MFEDMEKKGIVFDLQWKTRNLVSSGEEFASIGIWEVDDTSLDWSNFKPYLCQTLGNVENLSVSYVDSDGDLIPIESDCEFQEALKYARRKAAMGQKLILKVEKLDSASGGVDVSSSPIYIRSSNFLKERLRFHTSNNEDQNPFHLASASEVPIKIGNLSSKVKCKGKASDVTNQIPSDGAPPLWFKKYMQKMKKEIVEEVTTSLTHYFTEILDGKQKVTYTPPPNPIPETSEACALEASIGKNMKKVAEENSSETVKMDISNRKLLRRIEKLRKREKKLDHKKEKLEQKSKKIAERKEREYLSKLRLERAGCRRPHCDGFIRKYKEAEKLRQKKVVVNEAPPEPPQEPQKPILAFKLLSNKRTHSVKRGCKFLKKWKVVNTGNVPWTDETEVRLSWGNSGLEADGTTWKCPPLQPGEEGEIFIKFYAPDFPGLFESHWNLFHKNARFGNGLSVIIAVDLITSSEDETKSGKESSLSSNEFSSTPKPKTVKDKNDKQAQTSKEQNGSLIVTDSGIPEDCVDKIFPKLRSFMSPPLAWESLDDAYEEDEKEAGRKGETTKEGDYEIAFSDDFNGSISSVGSDSDENFVVVPMPPCFRFDVPLKPAKEDTSPPAGYNPLEESITMPIPSSQKCLPNKATASTSSQQQSEVSNDTGEVVNNGKPFYLSEMNLTTGECIFRDPDDPDNIKKVTKKAEWVLPPPLMPTPASAPIRPGSVIAEFDLPPPGLTDPNSPSSNPNGSSQNPERPPPAINIPTTETRFSPRPRPIDLLPPVVSEVWTDAMNVTTSALNTALSAIDTIIGPSATPGTVHNRPPTVHNRPPYEPEQDKPREPRMIEDLSQLTNMGFFNFELNEALLRVHNHDISKVVELLVEREN